MIGWDSFLLTDSLHRGDADRPFLRLLARELDSPLKHTLDTVIRHYVACHGIDLLRAVGDRSLLAELELGMPSGTGE